MYSHYLDAIRERVCARCIDTDTEGNCLVHGEEVCALEDFLPSIIEVVRSVNSDKIEDYAIILREKVCTQCKRQSAEGRCVVSENLDCGLDRYLPLIVETIEEIELGNKE